MRRRVNADIANDRGVRSFRSVRSKRGAVLIEAAMCVQLLAILAFCIVDTGFAYRDKLTGNSSVRGTVRTLANAANSMSADYQALLVLRGSLGSIDVTRVNRVVFYASDASGNPVNAACLTPAAVASRGYVNQCNVYSASDIFTAGAGNFTDCVTGWHKNFCPTSRVRPGSGVTATDIGVWLSFTYTSKTKLFPFVTLTVTDQAVMRLEPQVV
jgi:Flp pilus assembly protein TadG